MWPIVRPSATSVLVWLVAGLLATTASAGKLVVYYPDGPQEATKVVAAFGPLQAEAKKSGLELSGSYFVQFADFQKFLDASHPEFGIVDVVFALDNAEKLGLKVLATAQDASGSGTQPYCLVTGSAKTWTTIIEARGASLAQTPLAGRYPYFVTDFLFEGGLPADFFVSKPVPHAASALRAVELGESDTALVPCPQVPKANKKLKVLYTSRPVPMPVLVAFKSAAPADVEKVTSLFLGLTGSSPVCQALGFGKFAVASSDFIKGVSVFRDNAGPSFDNLRVNKSEGADGSVVPSTILSGNALSELRGRLLPPEPPE